MEVVVMRQENYGTIRFYPVCEKAKILTRLSHRKTLDIRELHMIKDLGFEVVVKHPEVKI